MRTQREVIEAAERYRMLSFTKLEPIVIVEGRGATLWDMEGREYIDCYSGISVVNSGHCPQRVVEAIKRQAERLIHCGPYVYHTGPTTELAVKLAEITPPGLSKSFFGNSGAEANECALKLAKKFTKRHEIMALECSFHGRTIGTLSVTGQSRRRRYDMGPYLPGVSFAPAPYCYRCPMGRSYPECDLLCARRVEEIVDYHTSNNVAALIAEPILGEGGIIVPPPDYFKVVREILDERDILLIVDEVQTGFARTGRMFAIEHYGVEPEIMTLGKGIAAGLPLGVCISRADIGDAFEPGDHLSTFGGNPVCCAAALANIQIMEEEHLAERAEEKGRYLMKRLEELREAHSLIGDVRGKGLMVGVELVRDMGSKRPAADEASRVREEMRRGGILIGVGGVKGSTLRLQPPLIIEVEQLERALNVLDTALTKVERGS
jgi:4-aminobutyrate aminotransferase/(S)-3-amino-2-methylpropionate transaminase